MINNLEIRCFKSIYSMDIGLGNLNLLIGSNGCGKTNILEAIGVLSSAVYGVIDDESLLRRGVRPGVPRLYKTSNKKHSISPHISFSVQGNGCEYKVSLLNPLEKPRPKWDYKTETFNNAEGSLIFSRGVRSNINPSAGGIPGIMGEIPQESDEDEFLQSLREYAIYNPNTPMLRGLVADMQTRIPVGLSGGGLADGYYSLLKEIKGNDDLEEALDEIMELFSWVQGISSETSVASIISSSVPRQKRTITFKDRFMREKYNKLTASDASEGILYALFLAVLCLSEVGPSVFAVDNIDQALNPRVVKKMMSILCDWFTSILNNKQIIVTAHNPSILDGISIADDRIRLFAVDRDFDGLTVIKRVEITDELLRMSKEKDMPLSRLWVEGYIGGVPSV